MAGAEKATRDGTRSVERAALDQGISQDTCSATAAD